MTLTLDFGDDTLVAGLNPQQIEVVRHERGPAVVVAGAGSGKSECIVRRIARLVAVRKVPGHKILAVTFSKKAQRELKARLHARIGANDVCVSTFHSFCRDFLTQEMPDFAAWNPGDVKRADKKYERMLRDAYGHRGLNWRDADLATLKSFVELAKAAGAAPGSDAAEAIAMERYARFRLPKFLPEPTLLTYEAAETARREAMVMTFGDWLVEAGKILATNADVRARWGRKFGIVIEDEGQDHSLVQSGIIEDLSRGHRNVMIVGDAAQTIFGFRGAAPHLFASFPERWDARVIKLPRNYRSGTAIVAAGNAVAAAMPAHSRIELVMTPAKIEPGVIRLRAHETQEDEGEAIAEAIKARALAGVAYQHNAILYRTNALSRAPEEALVRAKIPYHIVGGIPFYERPETHALICYMRLAAKSGAKLDRALTTLKSPFRYFSTKFFAEVERLTADPQPGMTWASIGRAAAVSAGFKAKQMAAIEAWAALIAELRSCIDDGGEAGLPAALIGRVVRKTNYIDWLNQDEGRETVENDKVNNVGELIRAAGMFRNVGEFLVHVEEATEATERAAKEQAKENRVQLMSIHRSKGLEFEHVHLITANDRVIPHARAEDLDEERRLFYVAVTRARATLDVSWVRAAMSGGVAMPLVPSPYVGDIRPFAQSDPDADLAFDGTDAEDDDAPIDDASDDFSWSDESDAFDR